MPKLVKYPRLRTHTRKNKNGRVRVYYFFNMQSEGGKDIPLGSDYDIALKKWKDLTETGELKTGLIGQAMARWKLEELPQYESKETVRGYTKSLKQLEPVFGDAQWEDVDLPTLRRYLDLRTAKTQGNREMSLLSIVWHKALLWGMTKLPWPAEGVRNWKNEENAREFEVTPELFNAVYRMGDQTLKDCMDIASATALRLTDARNIRLPVNGILHHKTSKTGKRLEFVVADSPVLAAIVERRMSSPSSCVMLLSTPSGAAVTWRMLRDRWDAAREAAAYRAEKTNNPALAALIRKMYLRDMRSFASDLAGSVDDASRLLQHSSKRITERHYRTKPERLKTVR
ncbi:site-specific integrase [Comamonas koreensis]|uniref:Integrase n=1 Tax=Comamonas koreensis TaxID=160825 RepID=A0AAW4XQG6_9BURK|nr:integrase [Comamonas koreensis]MCD2164337.1 integrase [Comamonas koreensis]